MTVPTAREHDDDMPRPGRPGMVVPVAVAIMLTTVGVLPVFLTGSLAVQIRHDLGLSRTGLGVAVSASFAAAACTSIFAGRIVRRLGAARTMRSAAAFQAVTGLLIALLARSPLLLVVLLGVAGLGNGAMQPAVNQFVSERVASGRQGLAFGIKQAAIPVATLLGGLSVPAIALTIGWRYGFGSAAGLAVVGWLVVPRPDGSAAKRPVARALLHRSGPGAPARPTEPPATRGVVVVAAGSPTGTRVGAGSDALASGNGGPGRRPVPPEPGQVARRALVVLAAGIALGSGAANGLGAFLVTAAVGIGFHPATAGVLAAMGSAAGLTARISVGAMADRRTFPQFRVVSLMLTLGAVGYLGLAAGDRWLFVPATLLAYGAGWGWNGLFNYTVVRAHPGAVAQATGITQAGVLVGGIVGPLGVGVLSDQASFSVVWMVAAGAAVAAALTIVLGRRMLLDWILAGGGRGERPGFV
ncbi:MAG: MFS transporter [Acidimicrobiales bacterium]